MYRKVEYSHYNRQSHGFNETRAPLTLDGALPTDRGYGNQYGHGGGSGGGYRGGGAPRPKKINNNWIEHKEPAKPACVVNCIQLLTRLGDYSQFQDGEDILTNIQSVSSLQLADIDAFVEELSDVYVEALSTLSMQNTIITMVIGILNTQKPDFTSKIVSKIINLLIKSLQENGIMKAKLLLRSLASLASCNCVSVDGLIDILDGLLTCVETRNSGQSGAKLPLTPHTESILYLIASTIPWALSTLTASAGGNAFLTRCHGVFTDLCTKHASSYDINGVNAIFHEYVVPSDEDGNPLVRATLSTRPAVNGSSCWDTLWEACYIAADLISQGTSFVPPSCMFLPALHHTMISIIQAGSVVVIPPSTPIDIVTALMSSSPHSSEDFQQIRWLRPRFTIFDQDTNEDVEVLCTNLSPFERYIAIGYYTDIFYHFEPFLRSDGTRVGSTELLLTHLNSVSKLYNPMIRTEYILVEYLFQMICAVPSHDTYNAGYYRILLELCKKLPGYPVVIAQGTSLLYQMLPEMDTIVVMELGRWLAFHLTNTLFSWPYWSHWADEINNNNESIDTTNHKLFISIIIDKCCRISTPNNIQNTIPVDFYSYVTGTNPYPNSALLNSSSENELRVIAFNLKSMVINKASDDAIYNYINECNPTIDISIDDGDNSGLMGNWKIRVLLHAIFDCAGIILSNMTNLLEVYSASICELVADNENSGGIEGSGSLVIIHTVTELFKHDQAMVTTVLDAMIRRKLIHVNAGVDYMTSSSFLATLTSNPWAFSQCQIIIERSVDMIRAAVGYRNSLGGGVDLTVTTSALVAAKVANEAVLNAVNTTVATTSAEAGGEGDEIDPDSRRAAIESTMDSMPVSDPVAEADAAVYSAILACRSAYSNIVSKTIIYLHETESSSPGFSVHGISLLHTILRVYKSSEKSFNFNVILSDRVGAEGVIDHYKKEKGIKKTVELKGEVVWKKFI